MKNTLLIIGIIVITACALSLAFSALNLFGYYNVLDGSAQLYARLHNRAVIFGVTGIILGIIGAVLIILRSKFQ